MSGERWTDPGCVASLLSYLEEEGHITTVAEAIEVVSEPWHYTEECLAAAPRRRCERPEARPTRS